jgi:hypothetical protein
MISSSYLGKEAMGMICFTISPLLITSGEITIVLQCCHSPGASLGFGWLLCKDC